MGLQIHMSPEFEERLRARLAQEYGELAVTNVAHELLVLDLQAQLNAATERCTLLQAALAERDETINAQVDQLKRYMEAEGKVVRRAAKARPVPKKDKVEPAAEAKAD